jgi:inorganic triphosphatase YgiF
MDAVSPKNPSEEIEIKLALPYSDHRELLKCLVKTPPLRRRKAITQTLRSVYYDTPDQILRQKHIALRVRQVDAIGQTTWIQTLKTEGQTESALSRRGEWEQEVPNSGLTIDALQTTPWCEIDPDGSIFAALRPCFTTRFERTCWHVRSGKAAVAAVSLDIGHIESGQKQTAICELELELITGEPKVLFELAQTISQTVAVLPASLSKAERGYALAQGTLDKPQRSRPPQLSSTMGPIEAGQTILREMYSQFTKNLYALLSSDNPEVVHQARIGWRRYKSGLWLFRPILMQGQVPDLAPVGQLWKYLGRMRDLDVTLTETMPLIAESYIASEQSRLREWTKFETVLLGAAHTQRQKVREVLADPLVGSTLFAITRHIEEMTLLNPTDVEPIQNLRPLRPWAERRVENLRDKLELAIQNNCDAQGSHRVRILAKRLRYSLESLQTQLPKRRTKRLLKKATTLQGAIGASRDIQRAYQFAAEFSAPASLVEFLRGYGCGITHNGERFRA